MITRSHSSRKNDSFYPSSSSHRGPKMESNFPSISKYLKSEFPFSSVSSISKRDKNKKFKAYTSKGIISVSSSRNSMSSINNYSFSSFRRRACKSNTSDFISQSIKGNANKAIKSNKNFKSKSIISNKEIKNEEKEEEIGEDINIYISINNDNNNNNRRKAITTTLPDTEQKIEKVLCKKRRKKHSASEKDNLKAKIKNCFYSSVREFLNSELKNVKIIKYFLKVEPILDRLNTNANFKNALSKDLKYILYSDEPLELYYKKKYKDEETRKLRIKELENNNKNNKEIINQIVKKKNNIKTIKQKEMKNSILALDEILNSNLKYVLNQYLGEITDKKFQNLKTIDTEIDKLYAKNIDEEYIRKLQAEAIKLRNIQ